MNRDDVTRMAREVGLPHWYETEGVVNEALLIKFATLVASAEREKLRGQIETLHAMYELASKQRDYLMDQQRAQVASIQGSMQ